jgi:hypothetical protein
MSSGTKIFSAAPNTCASDGSVPSGKMYLISHGLKLTFEVRDDRGERDESDESDESR